ncbi:hypothetical protein FHS90_002099 [Rufibacter quisquiliarum]|uniref:Uncharacterized protein n=1 Tax=Rufibacter quisquiliarum TaxID=1549639 RepID=A0A839GRA0_9BACT|nr:hypothetical protein [Rufibacter quisquiliarum]
MVQKKVNLGFFDLFQSEKTNENTLTGVTLIEWEWQDTGGK